MSPKRAIILIGSMILFAAAVLGAADLPLLPQHKEWLDTVKPIMTDTEREVFFKLKTNEERSKFIQFFWKQRDPQPDTEENEFYKEYMARVRYADENFGHDTGKRGSQTEQGFYYLILGAPLERTSYTTQSEILPLELWFYKGDERYGLPPYFYLIFYQRMGMGEYRLYYPGVEGPEALVIPSMTQQNVTRSSAYQVIRKINSELGSASLSYMPGERPQGMGSFSSDQIVAAVRDLPEKEFSDAYARNYLNYKDYVETEYTDSFTESTFMVKVFRRSGVSFLHWTLEPSRVNFAERNGSYNASFELVLRLEDLQGRSIYEQTEEIPLRVSPEQYKQHARQRFAFQDILPVIPGEYKVLFLLKNKTGKDFSSQEARISVPREPGPLTFGPLLLYRTKDREAAAGEEYAKAFSLDGAQFLFDTRNEFPKDATLGLYVQPFNLEGSVPDASKLAVRADIRQAETNAVVWTLTRGLAEVRPVGRTGIDFEGIPLSPLKPGYYSVEVSLLDGAGKSLASQKDNLILLTRQGVPLPWAYSRQRPAFPNAQQLAILGTESFASGDFASARDALRRSLAFRDAPSTRLLLAQTLHGLKAYKESLELAAPLYEQSRDREAAKVLARDYAGLQDWKQALVYTKELLQSATEVDVLNLTADCLIRLDRADEALPLIRKSLELVPRQEEALALEEQARKALKK
jgi:GWxTD domain-containing protein